MGMGAAGGGGGGGRRRGRRRGGGSRPMSDINVTPMVDVMLVLLIVFMVAAPLMTTGVPIDLPKTLAKQLNTEQKPTTISVSPEGAVFVNDETTPTPIDGLIDKVMSLAANGTEDRVYVRGDMSVNYGSVMEVMGALSGAGFTKIGLMTEQAKGQ